MRTISSQPAGWKTPPRKQTRRQVLAGGFLALTGASLDRYLPTRANAEQASTQPTHNQDRDRLSKILEPGVPSQAGMSSTRLQFIGHRLQAETQSGNITSASVLVARHGKVVFHQGFGRLNPDPGAPATQPDTVYLLASISKPVTACGLMLLVEQGRVQLSDPVQHYLPEFQGDHKEKVKVGHLLSHTSGLPDMVPENRELRQAHASLAEFVAAALRTPLLYEPGTGFSYQSMGTLLAGEITERMTNFPLRDFLRRKMFDPLGMKHTVLGLDEMKIEETAFCQESGDPKKPKHWGANSPYWRDMGHPWGGLHSTTGDLAVLLQTFFKRWCLWPVSSLFASHDGDHDSRSQSDGRSSLGTWLGSERFHPSITIWRSGIGKDIRSRGCHRNRGLGGPCTGLILRTAYDPIPFQQPFVAEWCV